MLRCGDGEQAVAAFGERRSAMPCSVTTKPTSARDVVTGPDSLFTIRLRPRAVEGSAMIPAPPRDALAPRMKSTAPPTAPTYRPPATSALT